MSSAEPELTIVTEEELTTAAEARTTSLLLQVGSDACERCPAFHTAVAALKETHQFQWAYCDAHDADTDVPEAFAITRLPAFVLYAPDPAGHQTPIVVANASPEQLQTAVSKTCIPVFTVDADF